MPRNRVFAVNAVFVMRASYSVPRRRVKRKTHTSITFNALGYVKRLGYTFACRAAMMPRTKRNQTMSDAPLLYSITDAKRLIGTGTTRVYELIGAGLLDARKAGGRTLITAASLRQYASNLPKADIKTHLRTSF